MNIKAKLTSLALAGTLAFSFVPNAGAINADTFNDVKPSDWYYNAVSHVVERNYFNGVSSTSFAPHQGMTRAMAVTVLSRMFGNDLSGHTGKTAFTDVPIDAYYAKAVQWAVQRGITNGTSAITFSPNSTVTREQINTFLYNAATVTGGLGSYDSSKFDEFGDKRDVASWAAEAVKWATSKDIMNGSNGFLKPKEPATRAAFATIIMNYDSLSGGSGTPTPDPTPDPEPVPGGNEVSAASIEDEINDLLVDAWGTANTPERDTGKLAQAARVIASGEIKDVEQALKSVGFEKPVGTVQHDKYTSSRYDARSFITTVSSMDDTMRFLKSQENIMDTNVFTEYGVGICKVNAIQFRVAVVTYDATPYIHTDVSQIKNDWKAEQAAIPVNLSDLEQQVIDLTNLERAKAGLAPLTVTDDMQKAARIRAEELSQRQAHTRPDGRLSQSVYEDIGCSFIYHSDFGDEFSSTFSVAAENIAWGAIKTPSEVMAGWMNSPSHRKNILGANTTHIGVGVYPRYVNGIQTGYYWTQCFIAI